MTAISLDKAVESYLESNSHLSPKTLHGYRRTLGELTQAFPNSQLREFEPPEGTRRALAVLEAVWGSYADRTYNRSVSTFRSFFAWAVEHGHLAATPGDGFERRHFDVTSRTPFTEDECARIIARNPDPRDTVPLRLLLLAGPRPGTLRRLRFGDFDPKAKVIRLTLTNERPHLLWLDDADIWRDFAKLRRLRKAEDDDVLLPGEVPRVGKRTPGIPPARIINDAACYMRQRSDGRWETVHVRDPKVSRSEHGIQNWWYERMRRAEIVKPGGRTDVPLSRARITASRRAYLRGGAKEVRRVLGVGRSGTSSNVHENRDADQLDRSLRHLNHELRPLGRKSVLWWKAPTVALLEYVKKERDLVELSRVSIGLLGQEPATSAVVHAAAQTLIRAVQPETLIKRAQQEAKNDHSLLHGHSLVATWSALETMVGDVADIWPPKQGSSSGRQRRARRAMGLDRLEQRLDAVGLSGTNDPVLAQNFAEMQAIRNVFAHQRGRADATFVKECPQLGYVVGQQVVIDQETWTDMMVSAVLYAETVLRRVKQQLGVPMAARALPATPIRY
jgi:integrase